jgi:uncharacterized protein YqeY
VDLDLLESALRSDLTAALRARDQVRVHAIRSALAAIANAEAPAAPHSDSSAEPEVGRLVEHERRQLSAEEVLAVLQAEIDERELAAAEYRSLDRVDEADRMVAEAEVVRAYLSAGATA